MIKKSPDPDDVNLSFPQVIFNFEFKIKNMRHSSLATAVLFITEEFLKG